MIASNNGRFDEVRDLIEAKADVNLQDKYGQTAYVFDILIHPSSRL